MISLYFSDYHSIFIDFEGSHKGTLEYPHSNVFKTSLNEVQTLHSMSVNHSFGRRICLSKGEDPEGKGNEG